MFDDLFVDQVFRNFFYVPILFSIAVGIFFRNIGFVIIGALAFAIGYEIYADGGRIIVQGLAAAAVAHLIAALGGFFVARLVR